MSTKHILLAIFWFTVAHVTVWFQLNGQFLWPWFRKNEWVVASSGAIISFFYIWGTKHTVNGFEGLLWPARFIGFGIGMVIYAFMVSYFFKEGITAKTFISLFLSLILICIQVLWKTK